MELTKRICSEGHVTYSMMLRPCCQHATKVDRTVQVVIERCQLEFVSTKILRGVKEA